MNIENLINENLILIDLNVNNKLEALETMVKAISKNEKLIDDGQEAVNGFLKNVLDREEMFSTAVGYSFGIPHGKSRYVKEPLVAYARLQNEIDWNDEDKVKYIFLIGVPEEKAGNEHLEILVKLSTSY